MGPDIHPPSNSRERLAWGLLIASSLFARLIGLGHRVMSHDESLHALYSWYLAKDLAYQHDPMMHGPLLFHLNAALYRLFGVTDFSARLLPALAGTACVALLWAYRRWLGSRGAFAAATLVSLNPGLLAYSRYLRNDIYISLFTLLMVWALLRYRENRDPVHLLWLSLGLALSFTCKEVSFMHGTVLGLACIGLTLREGWQHPRPLSFHRITRIPWAEAAVILLTLALPFATGLAHLHFEWDPRHDTSIPHVQRAIFLIALGLAALSTLIAVLWFGFTRRLHNWFLCFSLFWTLQLLFYSTLLTNPGQGISSGLYGSLAYWLAQHDVARGAQDPLFYLSLHLLYEPILLLSLLPGLKRIPSPTRIVLLCWLLGNFILYSWAGEKMPWLLIHISLPLCLLAGPAIADLLRPPLPRKRLALPALLLLALYTHNTLRLNGPLAQSPREPLHYAHAGENLRAAYNLIERHLDLHPDTRALAHTDYAWPTAWTLRDRPVLYSPNIDPHEPQASVALVHPESRSLFDDTDWSPRGTFNLVHWPPQHLHALTPENLRNLLIHPRTRHRLLRFLLFRHTPEPGEGHFPAPASFLLLTREPTP